MPYSFHQRNLVTVMQMENVRNKLTPIKRNTLFPITDQKGQLKAGLTAYLVSTLKALRNGERVLVAKHICEVPGMADLVVTEPSTVQLNEAGQIIGEPAQAAPLEPAALQEGGGEAVMGSTVNIDHMAWRITDEGWKRWLSFNKSTQRKPDAGALYYNFITKLVSEGFATQLEPNLHFGTGALVEGVYLVVTPENEVYHCEHRVAKEDPTLNIATVSPRPLETRLLKADQLVPLWPAGRLHMVREYVRVAKDNTRYAAWALVVCNPKNVGTHRQLVQFSEQYPEQCDVYLLSGDVEAIPAKAKLVGNINMQATYNMHNQHAQWWWDKVEKKLYYVPTVRSSRAVDPKDIKVRRQANLVLMDVTSPHYHRMGIRQLIKRPFRMTDANEVKHPLIYSVSPCGLYKLFHNLEEQLEQNGYIVYTNMRK